MTLVERLQEKQVVFPSVSTSSEQRKHFHAQFSAEVEKIIAQEGVLYPHYEHRLLQKAAKAQGTSFSEKYLSRAAFKNHFEDRDKGRRYRDIEITALLREVKGESVDIRPGNAMRTKLWYVSREKLKKYVQPLFDWNTDENSSVVSFAVATFREPWYSVLAEGSQLLNGRSHMRREL